jgi:uncharacterized small protein (DUF1192 family)
MPGLAFGLRQYWDVAHGVANWAALKRTSAMAIDPDELPFKKKITEIVLGADLYVLSVSDLQERIAALEGEIARCREAMAQRDATKEAAAAFFKK